MCSNQEKNDHLRYSGEYGTKVKIEDTFIFIQINNKKG